MKLWLMTALSCLAGLCGTAEAKHHGHRSNDEVYVGRSVSVAKGETRDNIVVVGSSATLRGDVLGDVVVVGGTADVDSRVEGDLVALGSARLGSKAQVDGDMVVLGSYDADPAASIQGQKTVLGTTDWGPRLGGVKDFARATLFKLRPLAPRVWWSWGIAVLFLLLYVVIAAGAPRAVEACAQGLTERPMGALLAGLLGLAGLAPFAFVLAVSIAGLPVIPLLGLAAFAALLTGKAALLRVVGGRIARLVPVPALEHPVPATLIGGVLFIALCAVPVAGLAAWCLSALFGFGAALLAGVASMRREKNVAQAEPAQAPSAAEGAQAPTETPPLEAASLPRAGFWLRLAANVLDGLFFLVVGGITHLIALGLGGWALYQVGMWAWKSTTIGGMIVGIKGVRLDGRPMDLPVALVRHLASYLSALPMCLGFFWAGWDPEKQAWHDKVAGTLVVRVPKSQSLI